MAQAPVFNTDQSIHPAILGLYRGKLVSRSENDITIEFASMRRATSWAEVWNATSRCHLVDMPDFKGRLDMPVTIKVVTM